MNPKYRKGKLRDGIALISGQHIESSMVNDNQIGLPYLTGPADFPDGKIITTKWVEFPKVICDYGDILITVKGSGTGKTVFSDGKYCISRQLMAIRCLDFDFNYVYQFLKIKEKDYSSASSGLIPGISRDEVLNTEIVIPPLPEQKKIAEILGSWDTAIEQLETLIEKKQLLKRGLMQKLLSGKVRFPEFEGEAWGTAKIAQFFEEVSNKNKKNNQYTILSCSKIYGIVPQDQVFYKRIASEDIARYKIVEYSNLVYDPMLLWDASIGFVESVEKGVISPAYNTFKFIGIDGLWQYFRYLFKSHHFREKYKNISQGTNVRRRKAPAEDFLNIEFEISTSLNEKKHIISFLESLDSELHNLFAQLEALKTQKLGLMQQLLTGKRRV